MSDLQVVKAKGSEIEKAFKSQDIIDRLKGYLPSNIDLTLFVSIVKRSVLKNDQLMNVPTLKLVDAAISAAEDGLMPDGFEAAIVPLNGGAMYVPMYQGLIKLVRNTGQLRSIKAFIVHQNDVFDFEISSAKGDFFYFRPELGEGGRGEPIGVAAAAWLDNGHCEFTYMPKHEVEKTKKVSKAKFGPWVGDFYLEMWKKTAIRRLCKLLPFSSEIATRDEEFDFSKFEDDSVKTETVNLKRGDQIPLDSFLNKGDQDAE